MLGDIVISICTADRQARERGHTLATEVEFLTVHGCLHLQGYDHATAAQRRQMWKVQDEVIASLTSPSSSC
jgi:probable rRNA maturation factor